MLRRTTPPIRFWERIRWGGTSADTNDGTAIFIGVQSATANIARVDFSTNAGGGGTAINQVQLLTTPAVPVPEPTSLLALVAGLGSLGAFLRKRG
jgi:hypothetical protein